ncbi:MAG: NAD-dependent deacylase [Anaerolineales bacterium]
MKLPLVILTGAGISAESGVPTFRGAGGLWKNHRSEDLATPQAFARDPGLVWSFYAWRRELLQNCLPNKAHTLLAQLEEQFELTLITQNVDGLHQQAGSLHLIELHGNIWRLRCTNCERRWEDRRVPLRPSPPICEVCGAIARPDVVWFGERLPADTLNEAAQRAGEARTFAVIGTSAQVYPAAGLALLARQAGANLVEINPEPTPISKYADVCFRGNATEMVARWLNEALPA